MKISRFARGAAALMTAFLLLCLCGCDIQELSTLRAFAKPFEGEYRCEYARYGEKDLLESYRAVTLSLEGGTFTLTAVPVRGRKKTALPLRDEKKHGGKEENCYDRTENAV